MRRLRRTTRGAETLEFCAVVGLVVAVLALCVRGLAAAELQVRAESDARALARDAAVCQRDHPQLDLHAVDPSAPAVAVASTARRDGLVVVTVAFASQELVPNVAATAVSPHATVAMRLEPGCP